MVRKGTQVGEKSLLGKVLYLKYSRSRQVQVRTCLTHFDQIELAFSVGSNIVKNEAEDIMLDEEGVAQGLQHKVLHEGLGGVLNKQKISIAMVCIILSILMGSCTKTALRNFTPHQS